jgi:hypothetical protein
MTAVRSLVLLPVDDYVAALTRFASGWRWPRLALLIAAAALSWWVYVPVHELAHAFGCMLGGGSVSRLDIDPLYGAALLQRVFPFVSVGSEYAGQLTGFDWRGNDWIYLLTDFLPFVGTILIGVPMLRGAGRPALRPTAQALLFGAAIPVAFAPFMSLTGDYYEMGSILVSRVASWIDAGLVLTRWRSDDLFKLAGQLFGTDGTGTAVDALGLALSFLVGAALAFGTYALGAAFAQMLPMSRRQPGEAFADRFTATGTSE